MFTEIMTGQVWTVPQCWRVDGGGNHVAEASMGCILMILKTSQQGKVWRTLCPTLFALQKVLWIEKKKSFCFLVWIQIFIWSSYCINQQIWDTKKLHYRTKCYSIIIWIIFGPFLHWVMTHICSRYRVVPMEGMGLYTEESRYDDQAQRNYQCNRMKNVLTLIKL